LAAQRPEWAHLRSIERPARATDKWDIIAARAVILGALGVRIFIEEAAPRKGLPGCDEYAARVRYRLLPGVW